MFSGIIKHIGKVNSIEDLSSGKVISIDSPQLSSQVAIGDSIAINGVCLTVTKIDNNNLFFDVWQESLLRTTLIDLKLLQDVHMELALAYGQSIGGHPTSGHIDYIGIVEELTKVEDSEQLKIWISCPSDYCSLLPLRGSVAIAGVSLTITDRREGSFSVSLIPETLRQTLLTNLVIGSKINIETDFSARNQINQNALLSWSLPENCYPKRKVENNYNSMKEVYKHGLPVILQEKNRYYFVSSIIHIIPQVMQFILGISRSSCIVACNSFIAEKLAIPSAAINSKKQVRRQLLPIAHKDNDSFDSRASSLIKNAQIFLRSQSVISNWKSPGNIYAIQTSKDTYAYEPTIYEAAVHLALLVDKEDASICCEIHDAYGDYPQHKDIIDLALRYKLPLCDFKEVLQEKIPVENYK